MFCHAPTKGSGLAATALLCLASSSSHLATTSAFSSPPHAFVVRPVARTSIAAPVRPRRMVDDDDDDDDVDDGRNRRVDDRRCRSRIDFLSDAASMLVGSSLASSFLAFSAPASSYAIDDATTTTTTTVVPRSIGKCDVDRDDCVSTANIRDAKGSYSPPWTFETSPDEAFARIKGVLASDDSYVVTEIDEGQRYVRAYARRITSDADEVEFLVKPDDKVVLFRSTARKNGSVSDFGANRNRIDDIRKRGAVFGLMGDGMTADSYDGGGAASKGNNPWGQLKAFYGLQSGQGFEAVFEDED